MKIINNNKSISLILVTLFLILVGVAYILNFSIADFTEVESINIFNNFIPKFSADINGEIIYSNILDGGKNVDETSILGKRTLVREEEYWCAFQAELVTHKHIGDLIKDHLTRKILQAPMFEITTPSTIIFDNATASNFIHEKNIYIPKAFIMPRDMRDVEIVLAFLRNTSYDNLVYSIQQKLWAEFMNDLIQKGVLSNNNNVFFSDSEMSIFKRFFILCYDSIFFLITYRSNLSYCINVEIAEAAKACINRCFHITDITSIDAPVTWVGKKYLLPFDFIEERTHLNFRDSFINFYLEHIAKVDFYSIDYFKKTQGASYFYDIKTNKICFSQYVPGTSDPILGQGIPSEIAEKYYTLKVPYISWIKDNLQNTSLSYKVGDMTSYIKELQTHRKNVSLEIIRKEKFIEDTIRIYCTFSNPSRGNPGGLGLDW